MRSWRVRAALAAALLAVVALLTLAMPVETWRTGDQGLVPLRYDTPFGALAATPQRVWIDTDAACGHGERTDPDDCLALALLARAQGIEVAGVATVFGNARRDVVDATVEELAALLAVDRSAALPVWRGAAAASDQDDDSADEPSRTPAHTALVAALEQAPLTIVALGPLTNIAAVLRDRPDLAARVTRLVAVMDRRPGHLFHPAEGVPARSFLGHGPVFRDFNFALDTAAARAVIESAVALTLVPYDAARSIEITPDDVAALHSAGAAGRWLAPRLQPWLAYWREQIGRDGFYPFDLIAAAALVEPQSMRCARVRAWIGKDDRLLLPGLRPTALLVDDASTPTADAARAALYCAAPAAGFEAAMVSRLIAALAHGSRTKM